MWLVVPAGAVAESVKFSLRPIAGRLPGAVGPAVEALPHGAVFTQPVALRFAPRKEDLAPGVSFNELRVATLTNGRWELLPTSHPEAGVIQGLTMHFSTFALVAPCHVAGTGTDFPLSNCPTFNPRIQTSAPAKIDAIGGRVTLRIVPQTSSSLNECIACLRHKPLE